MPSKELLQLAEMKSKDPPSEVKSNPHNTDNAELREKGPTHKQLKSQEKTISSSFLQKL